MENTMKQKIPVTDADKEKSYFKYYDREPAPIAPQKMGCAFGGPMPPEQAVPFADRAKLLTDETLGTATGYTVMFDGTGYVSDVTFMPGVSIGMLDWYMGWRGMDPLRYVIVNPEEHISAVTMQSHKFSDEDLIGPEKYWDTTQTVTRMGEMGPATEFVNFKCPADVGFDMEEAAAGGSSLICARGYAQGLPPTAGPDYFIMHRIVPADGGVEVRTKCWIGWTVRYGKDYKQLPDDFRMPPVFAMGMYLQIAKEWANLAEILPTLYEEEKDR